MTDTPEQAVNPELESAKLTIARVTEQLKAYSEQYGLRGLEDRVQRGLDPAGMLAVLETRGILDKVAEGLGASPGDVIKLTNELHVGAIWQNADALAKGDSPAVQTWMVAAEVTGHGKEQESDLSETDFVKDLARVKGQLTEAAADPKAYAAQAHNNLIARSKEQFAIEDGVPVSDLDSGFLAMAVNGHTSGIVRDKDGLLFVGAKALDYNILADAHLTRTEKEDRGRKATFYIDADGKDVVKQLYPGFAIVFNGDKHVATMLARTGETAPE